MRENATTVSARSLLGAALAVGAFFLIAGCGGSSKGRNDLAFVSNRDGAFQLYVMDADGGHQHRLTPDKGAPAPRSQLYYQIDPAWSPSGRQVAFSSLRDGPSHIFVVDAEGMKTRRLTSGDESDSHPTWSPDGTRIAFARGAPGVVEIMNADGTGAHRITAGAGAEADPSWSPDGRWIAYARKTPGTSIQELWLVHPDGSGRHQLTSLKTRSGSPTWSSGSNRLAFDGDVGGTRPGIFLIGADGKGLQLLTVPIGEDDTEPAWSPNGEAIAFTRGSSIVLVSGGQEKVLTNPEILVTHGRTTDSSAAWNPRPNPG